MYKKFIFTNLFFLITISLFSQVSTQTIKGEVLDKDVKTLLIGAVVSIESEDTKKTVTDEKGHFVFTEIPTGLYTLKVEYLGYNTLTALEIEVKGGKETILSLEMTESSYKLKEVQVQGERQVVEHPVSIKTLTIEEVLRFPATYFDPARMAIILAGVVNTNDQGNSISVRGHSPNSLSWRLEGVEIVNPNHTPNAGTFSDRITLNGGGVNMLSAQMLGNSTFMTGAFPAQYGNSLGAIFDMNLREGNAEKHEFTAQVGLIGIDLAAEGPLIKKKDRSSFLVNYRYSTVGLLGQLGVDLGDEEISFQDLSFKTDFKIGEKGKISIFGVGGSSKNLFEAQRDTALWEFQKDRFDISFSSQTGIIGGTYEQSIGVKSYWKTTIAHSATENTRTAVRLNDNFEGTLVENDEIVYQKTALNSTFTQKISAKNHLKIGLDASFQDFDILSVDAVTNLNSQGEGGGSLLQPFVSFSSQFTSKMKANIGLHYNYFTFNKSQSIEPRAAFIYGISPKQNLSFAYGLHSQLQSPILYFSANPLSSITNHNLGFTKAHHYVLSYTKIHNDNLKFTFELYYQDLFDVPVSNNETSTFSSLNLLEEFVNETLVNEGKGRNMGLEISLQKYFSNNFYFLLNTTLYDAKYKGADGIERDARYNGQTASNLTIGKEWTKQKENKTKTFGVNMRVGYAGGFRYTPIDIERSQLAGTTIFDESRPFSEKYKNYFKIDARVYWKKSKKGRGTTLALDLQNLSNQENIAFSYFDVTKGEVVVKNQLGLIPILSWKIEF